MKGYQGRRRDSARPVIEDGRIKKASTLLSRAVCEQWRPVRADFLEARTCIRATGSENSTALRIGYSVNTSFTC